MSPASSGWPNSSASPSLGGSRPVSIFIVVVLPQPFEPTKAEDLAALDGEADVVDGGEIAEAAGQVARDDHRLAVADAARRNVERAVPGAPPLRQQRDEGVLDAWLRRSRALSSAGEPVASDAAVVHRDEPVEPLGLLHVGGRDDDAHAGAARAHAVDQFPELPARQRIDAGRRLVEDQQVGIVDQRAAQAELLPHAAGQLLRRPVGERREAGAVEQVARSAARRSAAAWPNRRPKKSMFSRTLRSG